MSIAFFLSHVACKSSKKKMRTGDWIVEGKLYACRYPRTATEWATLADYKVTTIVNLHAEPHMKEMLNMYGITEVHLFVPNDCAPTMEQLHHVLKIVDDPAQIVAINCQAGLGRTGTMAACIMVDQGMTAQQAIDHVRQCRDRSIESRAQEEFVKMYAKNCSFLR